MDTNSGIGSGVVKVMVEILVLLLTPIGGSFEQLASFDHLR
jgi:hypothetical protein